MQWLHITNPTPGRALQSTVLCAYPERSDYHDLSLYDTVHVDILRMYYLFEILYREMMNHSRRSVNRRNQTLDPSSLRNPMNLPIRSRLLSTWIVISSSVPIHG